MPQQVPTAPRRSQRHNSTIYESNGRDYLASLLGWSRADLECWLTSDTVRPHLQLWYQLCFKKCRRFNVATEWINTGLNGYFYNVSGLEEDLLLLCLGEGNVEVGDLTSQDVPSAYAQEETGTYNWITQEMWARTAWRIVQDNRRSGQTFEQTATEHPAFAYGFVIDVLCIAFHSMAFRKTESVWERIIVSNERDESRKDAELDLTCNVRKQVALDQQPLIRDEEFVDSDDAGQSIATTEQSTLIDADSDFEDPDMPCTPNTNPTGREMASLEAIARRVGKQIPSPRRTQFVQTWMRSLSASPSPTYVQDVL